MAVNYFQQPGAMPAPSLRDRFLQGLVQSASPQALMLFANPEVSAQRDQETSLNYLLRRGVEGVARLPAMAGQFVAGQVVPAAREMFDTPAKAAQRTRATTVRSFSQNYNAGRGQGGAGGGVQPGGFPNSYSDPLYGELEQQVARQLGIPAQMLAAVRLAGERSNNDQVSGAGARTPYQFIPKTRADFQQKYGVDAWRDPASAVLAAGLHLKENLAQANGDPALALRMYHGGPDSSRWGPENAGYAMRTASYLQNPFGSPLAVPFDASYGQQAIGQIDQGLAAASQPFVQDFQMPGMPEAPELMFAPRTDFSKADAAFQASRPQSPEAADPKRRQHLQMQGILSGLGQALSGLPEGAGLGKVLASIGGGMLAGRSAGEGKFDAEMDRYQDKLAEFNQALGRYELGKASQLHAEAVQDAQLINTRNWNVYAQEVQRFNTLNNVQATSQGFSVTTFDPKTGQGQSRFVPNTGMLGYQAALQKADVLASQGGQLNGALQGPTSVINGLVARESLMQMQQQAGMGQAGAETALLAGPFAQAGDMVRYGYGPQLFGDKWEELVKGAREQLMLENPDAMGQPKLAQELMANLLQGKMVEYLVKYGSQDQSFMQQWGQFAPMASGMAQSQMARDARTTTKQDNKGGYSVSTIYGGGSN